MVFISVVTSESGTLRTVDQMGISQLQKLAIEPCSILFSLTIFIQFSVILCLPSFLNN